MCVTKISLTNNKRLFYLSIVPSLVIHSMISFSEGMTKSLTFGWDLKEAHTSMGRGCPSNESAAYIYKTKQEFSIQPHTPHHINPNQIWYSIPWDQLKKLICRNDSSLGVQRAVTNFAQNVVNFTSWHFITRTNVLEDVLNAISTDGGVSIVLTGGCCGLDDVLSESTWKFLRVAVE